MWNRILEKFGDIALVGDFSLLQYIQTKVWFSVVNLQKIIPT